MKEIQMKILVDIDGVSGDLVGEVLDRLNERRDMKFTHEHITEWNFFHPDSDIFNDEELADVNEIFCQEGLTNEIKLMPGIKETLEKLVKEGHEIVWLTAPWKLSKTWCYDRTVWIERELGHISKNIIFAWNKECIPGDILIDDNPEFLMKWKKHNLMGQTILFKQPWNIKVGKEQGLHFMNDWNDVQSLNVAMTCKRLFR